MGWHDSYPPVNGPNGPIDEHSRARDRKTLGAFALTVAALLSATLMFSAHGWDQALRIVVTLLFASSAATLVLDLRKTIRAKLLSRHLPPTEAATDFSEWAF
jgi:hypothetical protein